MEKKINVNTIPSLTWNWLKMNKDSVELADSFEKYEPVISNIPDGFSIDSTKNHMIDFPLFGTAVANRANLKMPDSRVEETTKTQTFAFDSFGNHPLQKVFEPICNDEQFIKITDTPSAPLILNFTSKGNTVSSQTIYATENTESTIIFVYESDSKSQIIRTKIYAEENAKIHIIKVQLLDKKAVQLDDTAFIGEDNAKMQFTQIELGGAHIDSGLHVNLKGYKSNFTSNVSYICKDNQYLDMNHIVYHYGKKSECKMDVNGTVKDDATKTYRGTIDFKNGCAGSKGNEMEETLLLSPTAVNKSLPVILCDEEDVEGEHGSTIGRISQDILFYMQTRGISKSEAEKLMTRAKVQAVADLIPCDDVRNEILQFINK